MSFLNVTRQVIALAEQQPPGVQWPQYCDVDTKNKLCQIRDVLERWEISGINRKLQMKPQKWSCALDDASPAGSTNVSDTGNEVCTELVLILKWGGDLTPLGRDQALQLGTSFRHRFYPESQGGGVLRLHSTYRHDLKIKASDEGRVMKTAAAFTKGLLELEGQLTPILASLVTVEDKNRLLLDRNGNFEIMDDVQRCKDHMNLLQSDELMNDALIEKVISRL